MCRCTPDIRTPFCGKPGCQWPAQKPREMVPCLKQLTRCVIVRDDGRRYEATNACAAGGLAECPRVTAGCKTGTGYELCGSTHAEANAAAMARESADVPGTAYLYGHTWFCGDCQHALTAVGVRKLVITGEAA